MPFRVPFDLKSIIRHRMKAIPQFAPEWKESAGPVKKRRESKRKVNRY